MKLGLALGGGGARGGAHIGALYELYTLDLKPDLITGTSIGALIGAMVAAGMPLEDIESGLRSFKPGLLYALPQGDRSFASTEKIENKLLKIFQAHYGEQLDDRSHRRPTFADLETPLAVVATDLVTQREVVLDTGDLVRAIMASISIPVLFPPVQIGEKRLVDGGLINNVPFDVARSRGATYTIAVDLGMSAPYGTKAEHPAPGPEDSIFDIGLAGVINGRLFDRALYQATRGQLWQVVTAVVDIVNQQNVNLRLATSPPDVLVRPQIGTIGILDFHTIDESIKAGREAVHRVAPQIEKLITLMVQARQAELDEEAPNDKNKRHSPRR